MKPNPQYDRFTTLLRRIVTTPKSVVDARAKEEADVKLHADLLDLMSGAPLDIAKGSKTKQNDPRKPAPTIPKAEEGWLTMATANQISGPRETPAKIITRHQQDVPVDGA